MMMAEAGRHLMRLFHILNEEQRVMGRGSRLEAMNCIISFNSIMQGAGCHLVPKNHMFVHMGYNIAFVCNPRVLSTYTDESENGDDAKIGRRCHMNSFSFTVLAKRMVANHALQPQLKEF